MVAVEEIFERLMVSGVKEAVLFKKSGKVIKTNLSEEKTLEYMGLSKEILNEFKNILRGLTNTSAEISSISIQTDKFALNLINTEKTILFFTIDDVLEDIRENLDIGERVDNLFE